MTAIRLERLTKRFGGFTAVDDLDLSIADGEFVALLGPSGCGKSTTMNMIAGMEAPTSGRILFDGADVTGTPPGRRKVGFVFQTYAIFTDMTIRQNLAYGPKAQGWPRAEVEKRTAEVADLLGLTQLLDRRAAGLSVNILQRVAIGRSAAVRPAIFLLDEPLSNVDAAFRAVMRTELKRLQRELRQTMVYVTHDQLEAMTMADRIAVMDRGVLQQVGSPLEVYNRPRNRFVAEFLGSPGMNMLPARLADDAGAIVADVTGLGRIPLDGPLAAAARAAPARDILYGFRPEAIHLGDGIALAVTVVERIGARVIAHFGEGAGEVVGVLDGGTPLDTGAIVPVRPDPAAVRLFDAASGRALEAA